MQIAIVGLARSGKTTVFNTLTRGHAETGGFGGMTVNVGVVKVPDERLTGWPRSSSPRRSSGRRDLRRPAGAARVAEGRVGAEDPRRPARPPARRRMRCSTWCARSRTRP